MNSLIVERRVENSSAILGSPSKAPGAGFKSRASYHVKIHTAMFIFAFKAAGRWFESSRPLQISEDVAQLIEQRIIVVWPLGSC